MQKEVKRSWALFIGIGVMMIAHGLQMQIMGIRSVIEDFSVFTTGIFMSGYYVGYFVGSRTTPNFVSKVGHIRVFAAFASLASLSALVAVVYINPFMWTISRFITGISLVSCYVVTESWLNDRATNKNRGQLLSAYMMVIYFGLAVGMLLLNVSKPEDYEPFILVSILLSVALVPILLTKRPAPKFKKIETISIKELYKISPLGTLSSFFTGIIHAAFFSLIAVYATKANYTLLETSVLLFISTIAGVIGQGPIGYFSDTFDRRKVIVITTFGSSLLAFLSILSSNDPFQNIYHLNEFAFKKILFFIFVGLYSSLCLPLFSLNLAHTNDFVPKSKFVAAGGGLQFIFGVGAISGPILCSIFMEWFGLNGLFVFLIIAHAIIGTFGLYRMKVRDTVENPDSTFTPVPATITPAGLELDPDAKPIEEPNYQQQNN
ncbi:MFS transporter [Candidatus Pelagibacter communis]|uniref:MFS transporter n=1 Tax=Pelagibacter ubique TaxID=198252 RepID=UPI00092D37BA|nr:MFS transporter [Candidatus Pelagibacter ubique]